MVIAWLPSLILSLVLSVVLTIILNLVLNVLMLPALIIGAFVFFGSLALIRLFTPA